MMKKPYQKLDARREFLLANLSRSAEKLAREVGVSRRTIAKWCAHNKIPYRTRPPVPDIVSRIQDAIQQGARFQYEIADRAGLHVDTVRRYLLLFKFIVDPDNLVTIRHGGRRVRAR